MLHTICIDAENLVTLLGSIERSLMKAGSWLQLASSKAVAKARIVRQTCGQHKGCSQNRVCKR